MVSRFDSGAARSIAENYDSTVVINENKNKIVEDYLKCDPLIKEVIETEKLDGIPFYVLNYDNVIKTVQNALEVTS
jgi:hypothetical protein